MTLAIQSVSFGLATQIGLLGASGVIELLCRIHVPGFIKNIIVPGIVPGSKLATYFLGNQDPGKILILSMALSFVISALVWILFWYLLLKLFKYKEA